MAWRCVSGEVWVSGVCKCKHVSAGVVRRCASGGVGGVGCVSVRRWVILAILCGEWVSVGGMQGGGGVLVYTCECVGEFERVCAHDNVCSVWVCV